MITLKHMVLEKQGIHAKPASILVGTAKKFHSSITLCDGDECVNMKEIFPVMRLGIRKDTLIEIQISGEDEAEAAKEVEKVISTL